MKKKYDSPIIQVMEVRIEKGFASSGTIKCDAPTIKDWEPSIEYHGNAEEDNSGFWQ